LTVSLGLNQMLLPDRSKHTGVSCLDYLETKCRYFLQDLTLYLHAKSRKPNMMMLDIGIVPVSMFCILSRYKVTTDGSWINNRIYSTGTLRNYH
jgi:hypothetical protein